MSSSTRLFVKNLPKHATDATIREHFSKNGGEVTDAKVLKNEDGTSKCAAFLGFRSESDAANAQKYFDKTFMHTSRLSVTIAKPVGDPTLERLKSKAKGNGKANEDDKKSTFKSKSTKEEVASDSAKKADLKHREFLKLMKPNKAEAFWSDEEDEGEDGYSSNAEEINGTRTKKTRSLTEKESAVEEDVDEIKTEVSKNQGFDRLFIRNLPFTCTKQELEEAFKPFRVVEVILPVDATQRPKGFGIVKLISSKEAEDALAAMDRKPFQGRLLHVLPAEPERNQKSNSTNEESIARGQNYKTLKEEQRRKSAGSKQDQRTWHSLFIRGDAAAGAVAKQLRVSKRELIMGGGDDEDDVAVRVAMSEAKVISEGKAFLESEGVNLEALEATLKNESVAHSEYVLIAKNLPENAVEADLKSIFAKLGTLDRFVMPPSRTMALISYQDSSSAKKAMATLAYSRYKNAPLYLQYAPENVLASRASSRYQHQEEKHDTKADTEMVADDIGAANSNEARVLFVKNLEFSVTESQLAHHVLQCCKVSPQHVTIPKKRGKRDGEILSSGYGFVQFPDESSAKIALKHLQGTELRGHVLAVQVSANGGKVASATATAASTSQPGTSTNLPTKLVVRNLAFEATKRDVRKLFDAHAEVKSVRLPRKMDGSIRGFAFVEFTTHQQAKNALQALGAAHLYGRRLVAEFTSNTDEEVGNEEGAQTRKRMRGEN